MHLFNKLSHERELGPNCDRKACMDCLAGQTDQEMASSNINQLTNNVILTEDDIPGAKKPRESLEHCRIWRMCPAKQSMHALRSRFVLKLPLVLEMANFIQKKRQEHLTWLTTRDQGYGQPLSLLS